MTQQRDIQRERLFFIEFLAIFSGQVSRKDLVTRFGISEPAATKDLALYGDLAPGVLEYDLRKKAYLLGGSEDDALFVHDVNQALFALVGERAIALGHDRARRLEGWVSGSIKRALPLGLVSTITRCIYQKRKMTATYLSLNSGKKTRFLSPLALVHDGLRWHVRCFDEQNSDFRDFNLTRFYSAKSDSQSDASLAHDEAWNTEVTLELSPHPKAEFPDTISLDYAIEGEVKAVQLKACLVGYFLREWNIDFSDEAKGNPRAQHLYLTNKTQLLEQGVPRWALKSDLDDKDQ